MHCRHHVQRSQIGLGGDQMVEVEKLYLLAEWCSGASFRVKSATPCAPGCSLNRTTAQQGFARAQGCIFL